MPLTQPKTDLAYLRSEKAKAEQQLRYYQHREKILEHQIPELTRKARVHRLCTRAGMLESFLIAPEEPAAETGFKGDLCGCRGSEERRVKQRNHYIIIYE
jgi:hypothetical protein